ncbi:hypothetical protein EV174_004121, partial [Coemansia sp. RSA 2320]
MALNIDCLDTSVLRRIIAHACQPTLAHGSNGDSPAPRLREYKRLLPLASVSRAWREHASAHLHSTVILEYRPTLVRTRSDDAQLTKTKSIKVKGVVAAWASRSERPSLATVSSANSGTPRTVALWHSNLPLVARPHGPRVTTLCIQAFDTCPDYTTLLSALLAAGFTKRIWPDITCIEIRDYSEQLKLFTSTAKPADREVSRSSSSNSASSMGLSVSSRTNKASTPLNTALTRLTAELARHAPRVSAITTAPWESSTSSRHLAGHLVGEYLGQLQQCNAALVSPIMPRSLSSGLLASLSFLSIQTSILRTSSGLCGIIPAAQLCTLKLLQAEAFFSWEAFASPTPTDSQPRPAVLEFTNLTVLAIDFEKDHVANDTHRYDALKGGHSSRVSMGVDKRRLLFPKLSTLCIRKVPYTYAEAWSMFLESPIKSLAVAGKYAHIRYMDTRILRDLDVLDMHVYLSEKSFGRFTSYVKGVLSQESTVKSAWIRHSEVFPISMPETLAWCQLEELSITAYVPAVTLLAAVAQLPMLRRLTVQRIARDDCEAPLEPAELSIPDLVHITPTSASSTSMRDLQLHLGGSKLRASTLQAIIYVVLSMPNLRRLAVKQVYWSYICGYIAAHQAKYPNLQKLAH